MPRVLLVDCAGRPLGYRVATLDVIGFGTLLIAGVLKNRNIDVDLLVFEKYQKIAHTDPLDYAALLATGFTQDEPTLREAVRIWKRKHPDRPAIVGGPAAARPRRVLAFGYDVAVIGEGEAALEDLIAAGFPERLDREQLSKIRNLAYLSKEGELVVNDLRPFLRRREMDCYHAATELVTRYPFFWACRVYLEVVRGCSNYRRPTLPLPDGRECAECGRCRSGPLENRYYCPEGINPGCGYCSVPSLFGPSRSRSIDWICKHIREFLEHGVRRIVLSGSDFLDYGRDWLVEPDPLTDPCHPTPNLPAIRELLDAVSAICREYGAVFMIENVKACLVTEEAAALLGSYLKDTPVHIGVETGDPDFARELGRPYGPDEAFTAVQYLRRHGLRPYVYFIHGLPGETDETLEASLRCMRRLWHAGVEKITVYRFQPLPLSAFELYPRGPPAKAHRAAKRLVEEANRLNHAAKELLVGRRIECIPAAPHPNGRHYVCYPLRHGPVVLVPREQIETLTDQRSPIRVRVEEVAERFVKGSVVTPPARIH